MPPKYDPNGPSGIGGWLIIPLLGLLMTILTTGFDLVQTVIDRDYTSSMIFGSDPAFTDTRLSYTAYWISGLLLFLLALYCLFLMLSKSPRTPNWMIAFTLLGFLDSILEFFAYRAMQMGDSLEIARLTGSLLATVVWVPYFRMSKRVANTFRRPGVDQTRDVFS